jgi:thymidylate kinase
MARGKLIVFEGLDRAGKSTQCEKLVEDLRNDGVKVRHMRFPGTLDVWQAIRGVDRRMLV